MASANQVQVNPPRALLLLLQSRQHPTTNPRVHPASDVREVEEGSCRCVSTLQQTRQSLKLLTALHVQRCDRRRAQVRATSSK